jgi:hypothetical protein
LKGRGISVGIGTLWRFFDRRRITFKKRRRMPLQRCDVKAAREAWFEGQLDLDPVRLIFIDETSASTKMARLSGGLQKESAGLRIGGLAAPWVLDGPMAMLSAFRPSRFSLPISHPVMWS